MKAVLNWLDHRTGIRAVLHSALYEHIPGGARWRYVWGSTLVFAFVVQLVTGVFLWMAYSPSGHTAWESVYYIQNEMQGGWLLRGLHHFMAQAMVILLAFHLMQVVIDGAYRAPREVNFLLGLILMQIVLGLSLTGYLLPWDQKGYWATRVATNLMGLVPVVGTQLQKLVVGGADYGHHTLTRFFALHAGVLPGLLIGFLVLHLAIFRRHGIHAPDPHRRPDTTFWPDQILKDSVACLAVLAVVLFVVVRLGADLGAPADPSHEYSAARPEWYFLFLFQFLKLFEGGGETGELIGGIVVPFLVLLALFAMPWVGRWKLGHRFNVGLLLCLLAGIGVLTAQALYADNRAQWAGKPSTTADKDSPEVKRYEASSGYLRARHHAELEAKRVLELIENNKGIPAGGALTLLRDDPKTQGPRLFARWCASCHLHDDSPEIFGQPSAPDLTGFGTRKWIAGLVDPKQVDGPHYFGNTSHNGENGGQMVEFIKTTMPELEPADVAQAVAALSAQAQLVSQHDMDKIDAAMIQEGIEQIELLGCIDCHKFRGLGDLGTAPDLTGYASREWLLGMISNPAHERFYGDNNDRMPAFAANPDDPRSNILSPKDLELLVDWLRGEWYRPPRAKR
ncbi:MAG: cytochrome b N-terminal domain-containing protein [Pirellulales bacterium]